MSETGKPLPSERERPADRVRRYILDLAQQPGRGDGPLPTMRELAAHLSVSLATVQSACRTLKREGRITARVGDGTYLVRETPPPPPPTVRKLFLNHVERFESTHDRLLGNYYGSLLQAVSHSAIKFELGILDASPSPEEPARALFEAGKLDAMLIFPFTPCQPLVDFCDERSIPYVTVHPAHPHTSANFVTPDFLSAGYRMGDAFRLAGRRRAAVLAYGNPYDSTTGWALLAGLANGWMKDGGRATFEQASFNSIRTDHERLRQWLHERRHCLPDVILCHRSGLYKSLLELLAEMNVPVPEAVSVISVQHGPHDDAAAIGLTRVAIDFETTAETALNLLIRRIESNAQPVPGIQIPLPFAGGATTTPEENRLLGI
ncbi:MAG TPA: substrate-binding domain-containing protein [Chthoniobacteraceae bacterium]|nr:substrate-binding domain-containing protein [Chthoniobacteraceae bacterium]